MFVRYPLAFEVVVATTGQGPVQDPSSIGTASMVAAVSGRLSPVEASTNCMRASSGSGPIGVTYGVEYDVCQSPLLSLY